MKSTISIPSPCSEDWNKMTPTDKGAFCGKCQFEVIDFTGKEPEEIKRILKERSGARTCGHISKVDMELVNSDFHLWENQKPHVFKSKFLYACLMVFGMSLFTGCAPEEEGQIMGDMEQIDEVGMMEEDTSASCSPLDTGMVVDGEMQILEGEISSEIGDIEYEDGEIEMIEE
ncbi:MAG: hypothetical protein ABJG68_05520 [Crocinitomicaceae bacterium]